MCSAVCQQSHSSVPARTDQSRSVMGSSLLTTQAITLSRSSAVTDMMSRAYGHNGPGTTDSPSVAHASGSAGRCVRPLFELGLDLGLEDLPDLRTGQVEPDLNLLGGLDAADALLDEGTDLGGGDDLAGTGLHDGGDPLAPLLVRQADNGAVLNGRMGQQGLLHLGRVDVEAAGDDHVFGPVDDEQVAVLIQVA